MSFTYEESEIIRDADMDGTLKEHEVSRFVGEVQLRAHYLGMTKKDLEGQIGKIAIDLILLCAKLDLDLTTCIRKARKQ